MSSTATSLRFWAGCLGLLALLVSGAARAQEAPKRRPEPVDIVDEARTIFHRLPAHDCLALQHGRRSLLLVPVVGYTQQTSGVAELVANVAFERPGANMSTLSATAATSSLWTRDNRWNFLGDWRLVHYPQSTFGLALNQGEVF